MFQITLLYGKLFLTCWLNQDYFDKTELTCIYVKVNNLFFRVQLLSTSNIVGGIPIKLAGLSNVCDSVQIDKFSIYLITEFMNLFHTWKQGPSNIHIILHSLWMWPN